MNYLQKLFGNEKIEEIFENDDYFAIAVSKGTQKNFKYYLVHWTHLKEFGDSICPDFWECDKEYSALVRCSLIKKDSDKKIIKVGRIGSNLKEKYFQIVVDIDTHIADFYDDRFIKYMEMKYKGIKNAIAIGRSNSGNVRISIFGKNITDKVVEEVKSYIQKNIRACFRIDPKLDFVSAKRTVWAPLKKYHSQKLHETGKRYAPFIWKKTAKGFYEFKIEDEIPDDRDTEHKPVKDKSAKTLLDYIFEIDDYENKIDFETDFAGFQKRNEYCSSEEFIQKTKELCRKFNIADMVDGLKVKKKYRKTLAKFLYNKLISEFEKFVEPEDLDYFIGFKNESPEVRKYEIKIVSEGEVSVFVKSKTLNRLAVVSKFLETIFDADTGLRLISVLLSNFISACIDSNCLLHSSHDGLGSVVFIQHFDQDLKQFEFNLDAENKKKKKYKSRILSIPEWLESLKQNKRYNLERNKRLNVKRNEYFNLKNNEDLNIKYDEDLNLGHNKRFDLVRNEDLNLKHNKRLNLEHNDVQTQDRIKDRVSETCYEADENKILNFEEYKNRIEEESLKDDKRFDENKTVYGYKKILKFKYFDALEKPPEKVDKEDLRMVVRRDEFDGDWRFWSWKTVGRVKVFKPVEEGEGVFVKSGLWLDVWDFDLYKRVYKSLKWCKENIRGYFVEIGLLWFCAKKFSFDFREVFWEGFEKMKKEGRFVGGEVLRRKLVKCFKNLYFMFDDDWIPLHVFVEKLNDVVGVRGSLGDWGKFFRDLGVVFEVKLVDGRVMVKVDFDTWSYLLNRIKMERKITLRALNKDTKKFLKSKVYDGVDFWFRKCLRNVNEFEDRMWVLFRCKEFVNEDGVRYLNKVNLRAFKVEKEDGYYYFLCGKDKFSMIELKYKVEVVKQGVSVKNFRRKRDVSVKFFRAFAELSDHKLRKFGKAVYMFAFDKGFVPKYSLKKAIIAYLMFDPWIVAGCRELRDNLKKKYMNLDYKIYRDLTRRKGIGIVVEYSLEDFKFWINYVIKMDENERHFDLKYSRWIQWLREEYYSKLRYLRYIAFLMSLPRDMLNENQREKLRSFLAKSRKRRMKKKDPRIHSRFFEVA